MKKILLTSLLAVFAVLIGIAQPIISSFSPTTGAVGTIVSITGTNFNTTPTNNIVFFGATMATVSAATATQLTVTVPSGATYQYISVTNLSNNLTAYSLQPFNITFPCGGVIDSNAFAPEVDLSAGAGVNPVGILIADIDGDGKSDIIKGIESSNVAFSILRNTSTGGGVSFASKVDFNSVNTCEGLSFGDVDGDGKPDIITAGNNKVSVFKNMSTIGTIAFATNLDFTTGQNGSSFGIVIVDLDGDGKPDIASVNESNNSVSVLRNTSTGSVISFAPKTDFSTGAGPHYIANGDIDGDGKFDLAISNINGNTISVLKNTSISGTISFASKVDFATAPMPYNIVIGDLNGDNKLDLVVTSYSGDTISVFKNTSSVGTISLAPKVDFVVPNATGYCSIADLDGDDKLDIATLWNGGAFVLFDSLIVLKNISTSGIISFAPYVGFPLEPYSVVGVAAGDLNGDGKPDLAVTGYLAPGVSVLKNTAFAPAPKICMVTVDSASMHNIIYWDKTSYTNVNSFIVYRETISNTYKRIGAVSMDSLSLFIDTVSQLYFPFTGNPNSGTYRYKLQIRDTCGNYSLLSKYHNTIYVTQTGGTFNWNGYQIEGEATPIPELTAYYLWRDDNSTGNWAIVNGVSGSQLTITDPNYASYPNARWRIETVWSISCTPTRAVNSSRSNIKGNMITTGVSIVNGHTTEISIYPNPANNTITVTMNSSIEKNISVELLDLLGNVIMKTNKEILKGDNHCQLNISDIATGFYFIRADNFVKKIQIIK
ncbi:MAG: T9SS type A sorting domain-containing protein [Bacteroidetes bacterium]|nr:T9SS type A sorting domain-containing protein [Bacteroidota bacterium]